MYNKYLEKTIKLKIHIKNLVFKYNVFYTLILILFFYLCSTFTTFIKNETKLIFLKNAEN